MSDRVAEGQGNPRPSAARVGLALGGIVLAAVVIFSLGVMEGSRVAESVPVVAAPPSALPTETLPTVPATPIPPDKLTFYDRLSGVAPPAPLPIPEGQAPAQGIPPAAPPIPPPAAPTAALKAPAPRPEAPAPPAPATATVTPKKITAPVAEVAARTAVPPKPNPAEQIRKLTGKGRFTLQLAAVNERSTAAETAALIKRSGFEPVTVMASVKGKIFYRIRVGSFPTRQAAAQAAGIFRSAFGLNAIPTEN